MDKEKVTFEIVRHIGVLSEGSKGWKKEVNLINWTDRPIDSRDWDEKHEKMGKGITLSKEEIKSLAKLLCVFDTDTIR